MGQRTYRTAKHPRSYYLAKNSEEYSWIQILLMFLIPVAPVLCGIVLYSNHLTENSKEELRKISLRASIRKELHTCEIDIKGNKEAKSCVNDFTKKLATLTNDLDYNFVDYMELLAKNAMVDIDEKENFEARVKISDDQDKCFKQADSISDRVSCSEKALKAAMDLGDKFPSTLLASYYALHETMKGSAETEKLLKRGDELLGKSYSLPTPPSAVRKNKGTTISYAF